MFYDENRALNLVIYKLNNDVSLPLPHLTCKFKDDMMSFAREALQEKPTIVKECEIDLLPLFQISGPSIPGWLVN